jgi:hypothetical protein
MTSVDNSVVDLIHKMIRARRSALSPTVVNPSPNSSRSLPPAKLRQAQFSDCDAVMDLKRRGGLTPESHENWQRFWRSNPALSGSSTERPIGWVLEAEGGLVGYIGNISSKYYFAERTLAAVISSGLVVDPEYRSLGFRLIAAFHRQDADLFLATTAIPAVGEMARTFKSDPLPQADYDKVLFWVLQPYPFAQAVMENLGVQSIIARVAVRPGSLAIGIDKILHKRWPKKRSTRLSASKIRVDEIGDDFQALWIQKLKEIPRLLADRSPEVLRWHFSIPGDTGATSVFCCHRNGELVGYVVIRSGPSRINGLLRTVIADILVKQDDAEVVRTLLVAAYEEAKQFGSHVLEVLGFPSSIRKVCAEGNPYVRKYPATPFYYKAADPALHKILSNGEGWYATPFDGDTTLMP